MKKTLCIILIISMLPMLFGCAQLDKLKDIDIPELPTLESQTPETVVPSETPAPTETPQGAESESDEKEPTVIEYVEPGEQIFVSIKRTVMEAAAPNDDSKVILTYSYDSPIFSVEGNVEATTRINDYLASLEEGYYTGSDGVSYGYYGMLEQAEDNYYYVYQTGENLKIDFEAMRALSIHRMDSIISLSFTDTAYTGVESRRIVSAVLSSETGLPITLSELASDGTDLVEELCAMMSENDGDYSAALLRERLHDGFWYLDSVGLRVFSDPAELYADGSTVYFTASYSQLEGLIKTEYMPQIIKSGGSVAIDFAANLREGTPIYDKITVNTVEGGGQELALIFTGCVRDVALCTIEYADRFYETGELWRCNYIEDGAIELTAVIPEGMPNLKLKYMDDMNEEHSAIITQSGYDGSLILSEELIEAVG